MKSKKRTKTKNPFEPPQLHKISKINPFFIHKFPKIIPRNHVSIKTIQNQKNNKQFKIIPNKKMLFKSKSQINNEDSSTNFLSGLKEKKFVKNDISTKMKSETESFFINFKLGEKDSFMDNILINYSKTIENENKKKINLKQNFNYCKVNNYSSQNENDSFEIYDFNDETNVRYVLKNLSNLSCDKSEVGGGLSNIFEDLNEENWDNDEEKDKIINDIKIFEVKKNFINSSQKI